MRGAFVFLIILLLSVAYGTYSISDSFAETWGASLSGNGNALECDAEGCFADVLYDISGSYSFDINSNNSIQGSGTAQVTLTSNPAREDQYCYGSQIFSVSFPVSGNYIPSSQSVSITISNPNPSTLAFTQHCDYTNEPYHEEEPDEGGPIFDETINFPSPFNFQHDFGPGGLQMGVSASGEFSMGNGNFWLGSDINSLGSYPVVDSDGDGVPDSSDACPNEYGTQPDGCPVPVDSDGDGVSDAIDQCPGTAAGVAVDAVGCSPAQLDSDGDGVSDAVDQCSGTAAGAAVDAVGCPVVQDTSPPALIDLSFTPSTVDVSSGPATIQVTIHVTDDVSGFYQGQVFFLNPSGYINEELATPLSAFPINTLVSGTINDGIFSGTLTVPQLSEAGTWTVTKVWLRDNLINDITIYTSELQAAGFPTQLTVISESGGPVDSDGDGVSDAIDQCPGTAAGVAVDAVGCSPAQLDSDGDGVSDAIDQCPGTAAGVAVDAVGCSPAQLDSDGDGVPDSYDACPNEYGTQPDGCPVTSALTYDDYMQLGYDADTWVGALPYFEKALELKPNDFTAQLLIVTSYDLGYDDYETALAYANDALNDATDNEEQSIIQEYIGYLEGLLSGLTPTDISLNHLPTSFIEYVNYKIEGYLTASDGTPLSNKEVFVLFGNLETGQEVTSLQVTTDSNGYYSAIIGSNSFPGDHGLFISFAGDSNYDYSEVYYDNIQVLRSSPDSGYATNCEDDVVDRDPDKFLCDDFRARLLFHPDEVKSPGTVQYGQKMSIWGGNFRYLYPDNMIIQIYNPCDKLIHQSPTIIHTTLKFNPIIYATGEGWDITGVYDLTVHHETSGTYIAETTFTVQAAGPFVSSPSDSQCTGTSTSGTGSSSGSGSWKGKVTGYGTLYTQYNKYIYSIDGTFNFDILDNGDIKGIGISGVEISKTYGLISTYGNEYSCWSIDNTAKSISFAVKGEISNGKAYLYLADGSPGEIWLTIHCNSPGFHKDVQKTYDPFFFNSDAVLALKEGATATTTTDGPFAYKGGNIDWNFKITKAGELDPKFSSEPPKPIPVQPTPIAPKPIPIPTPPPQVTPAPPPKILPPQAPMPPKAPTPITPPTPVPTPIPTPITPPTPVPTPITPPTPVPTPVPNIVTLSIDTDRTTYNQGNLVTIITDIDGITSNAHIAISVIDPSGNIVMTRTLSIDDIGSIPFKILHGTTAGSYKVTASTNINGQNYEDRSQFTIKKDLAGLSIKSVSATNQQGNLVDSFSKGNQGYIKIVLSSDSFMSNSLITISVLDSDLIALGTSSIKTSINSDDSEIILSFYIPEDASVGNANIYVNAFTDWPSNGGVPLTREGSAEIGIGIATALLSTPIPTPPITQQTPPELTPPIIQPTPPISVPSTGLKINQVTIPAGTGTPGCEQTNLCYFPSTITINQGETVQWNNKDNAAHTVTSGTPNSGLTNLFDSSLFMAGTSYQFDFNNKGSFDYYCMVHPWMEGKVIVK